MKKPKILLLVDRRDWAYDHSAQSIKTVLSDEFDIEIIYVVENPIEKAKSFGCDLLHVFWWGEHWHNILGFHPSRVLKEISSFRWRDEAQFGFLDATSFAARYLADAGTLVATSLKMQTIINPIRPTLYTPNGVDINLFYVEKIRSGALKVGWAGNINDQCKGITDIIIPACGTDFELVIAPGNIRDRGAMRAFYNEIDVFCIASTAEGEPLTLIEALACGCYPVTVDVGIVPELVVHRDNGLIVNRSTDAFRAALTWCNSNLEFIRMGAQVRAGRLRETRSWDRTANYWRDAYKTALFNS
jgi:glycosyltransferase involved in cell wall biosynthesis